MRIRRIDLKDAGPLGTRTIDLTDNWSGSVHSRILFHGINGSGKSTILRLIATLWDAVGLWLERGEKLPQNGPVRQYLHQWGGCSILVDGVPGAPEGVLIVYGEESWVSTLTHEAKTTLWMGEVVSATGKPGKPTRHLHLPKEPWFAQWADDYKRMVVSFPKTVVPNMVFLDAEERRWVKPRLNIGEIHSENPKERWTYRYVVRDDWKGQLEQSLISLKISEESKFVSVLKDLNTLLSGKNILKEIRAGENRLQVRLDGSGAVHGLDELSAGEHQLLILVYSISRWMEKGGVVLIDEPDQYLHPSLIEDLLGTLERMVEGRDGQLLISSHWPDVWTRYENRGLRIRLGD